MSKRFRNTEVNEFAIENSDYVRYPDSNGGRSSNVFRSTTGDFEVLPSQTTGSWRQGNVQPIEIDELLTEPGSSDGVGGI